MSQSSREELRNGFAKRLAAGLRTSGMSQVALAKSLGVSKNTVTNWVQAKVSPDAFHVVAIARALRTTVEALVDPVDLGTEPDAEVLLRRIESTIDDVRMLRRVIGVGE